MKPIYYLKTIVFALVLFLSHISANARNYYVSSSYTGSVSNGALTTPWKSLSSVQSNLGTLVSGDSVLFNRSDRFSGTITIQSKTGISFGAYGVGSGPLFWGTGSAISSLVTLRNCNNVSFNNWIVSDTTISFTDRTAQVKIAIVFTLESSTINSTIRNCKMDRMGYGVYITETSGFNTIVGCDIGNLRMIRNTPTSVNPDDDYGGVPVQISSSNNSILNNYFHDCYAFSYDYGYDGGGVEFFEEGVPIENNIIAYNTMYDCNGSFEFGSNADGIANNLISNNKIYYNKIINSSSLFYINNNGQYKTDVRNLQFYNNVIIQNVASRTGETKLGSMAVNQATAGIVVLRNNVFQVSNGASVMRSGQWTTGQLIHTNNVYKLSGGSILNFTLDPTELQTTANFWNNTTNVNPLYWDLHPATNSLLINFGQNLGFTQDFEANPISGLPDAGVYEYANSTPVTQQLVASSTNTNIACNDGTSTVVVSATGGTAPYTGTGTFTVVAGTYSYIVNDAAGKRDTVNVTINQPTLITATVTSGTITIPGGSTSVTVTNVSGGTGNLYTYNIDGGVYQSSNSFSGVLAGNHTINIKDINGCIISKSFFINAPVVSTLTANAVAGTILCNGGTTTVTVSATGGVSPLTGTGAFTASAGLNSYTVIDAVGTTVTTSVTISQPTAISLSLTSGTIIVTGGTTSITATATGGTTAYSYKLNNGTYQSNNVFTTVAAGTHTVTVKDANGCTKSATINITQPSSLLSATAVAGTISCNGGNTTVVVAATGGTAPYTGTGSFTVTAGTYTYNVTDANGVNNTVSVTVGQPNAITLSLTSGTIITTGGSTSITATATSGSSSYTYKLNNGTYQASNVFTSVAAGTHTVTVKDANGCTKSGTITITQPSSLLSATAVAGTISCNGGNTTVVVAATGGTAPYTGTGSFTVTAGTYTYNVTDANGVINTVSVTVGQPSAISLSLTSGTIIATGATTSITATATGGSSSYTYKLDNGTYQASNVFTSVAAGTHTVTVKDANGCTKSGTITITQPSSLLSATATAGTIACNGGSTSVVVSATGGTAPYTGTGSFTVTAGTYTYNVTDANGVNNTVSVTVGQPNAITLSLTSGTIIATGGTTSITATATGGSSSYTYQLNNGTYQASNVFTSVVAGTHTITVKDANGCTKSGTITISQPSSLLSARATAGTIACNGGSTSVVVSATGGTAPYTGTGSFTVTAGTYTYNVTDANGVINTVSVTVGQPTAISLSLTSGTIIVTGGTTSITATATGGTTAYSYKLNNGTYQSNNVFTTVAAGTHTVTVKDANGCTKSATINITQPSSLLSATATVGTIACNGGSTTVVVAATGGTAPYTGTGSFTVTAGTYTYNVTDANGVNNTVSVTVGQPNAITLSLTSGTIITTGGSTSITATATGGSSSYTYQLNNGTYQASNVFTSVAAGTHTVTVKDANGCTKSGTITITQPSSLLSATAVAGTISCNGGNTTVVVAATGGTAPYTGTGSFTVTAGTYTYNVTDANGVINTLSVTVGQPTAISLSLTSGTIITTGGATSITATANGGSSAYTYKLDNGTYQTSNVFTSVTAGTHTVTVKDANGCTKSGTITISQPSSLLNATANSATIACNGGTTTITISAAGGTAPYTGTGSYIVTAGTYTYNVTDANGVVDVVSVTVTQPDALSVALAAGTIASSGGTTFISANVTGGTAPYSYTLDNGTYQTSNSFSNVGAGMHHVIIKDSKGCVVTDSINIADFIVDSLVVNVSAGTISCNGGTTLVVVSATGGVAPYVGVGSFTMSAGLNTITVSDATGTTKTVNVTISQPTEINVVVNVRSAQVVFGGSTSIQITATGGAGNYRYSLDGGLSQTSNSFRGIGAGTHSVSVVDQNGCVKMSSFIVTEINTTVGLTISLINRTNVTCIGANNGSITVGAAGGRAPYSYTINGIVYNTDGKFTNLAPGVYRATVKDYNGNTAQIDVTILDGKKRCSTTTSTLKINAYPNPSTSSFKVNLSSEEVGEITLQVFDVLGKMVHQEKGQSDKLYNFGLNFKPGFYVVKVIQADKCVTTKIIKQ